MNSSLTEIGFYRVNATKENISWLRPCFQFLIMLATMPATFLMVILGWSLIHSVVGYVDASLFIQRHQDTVKLRRADPRVHELSVSHDSTSFGRLLIQVDVDDKETLTMLENDFSGGQTPTFYPNWHITLRSNEELGNDLGLMAEGMGMAAVGEMIVTIALLASVFSSILCGAWLTRPKLKLQSKMITKTLDG